MIHTILLIILILVQLRASQLVVTAQGAIRLLIVIIVFWSFLTGEVGQACGEWIGEPAIC